jgi:hypothetical protein
MVAGFLLVERKAGEAPAAPIAAFGSSCIDRIDKLCSEFIREGGTLIQCLVASTGKLI